MQMSWAGISPRFDWRPSQRHLLQNVGHAADRRWHICAPPGAGKTLIGLELARRVDAPALALAPTTAIRDQWREATALFGADPKTFTSTDPAEPAPLLSVTYQLLGNPGDAARELRTAARRLWVADVATTAGLTDEQAAARVTTVEQGDPRRARRELKRHVRRLRRGLGGAEELGLSPATLLGKRPLALIDQLAGAGIGCVVLDECHHLLDWWALVVSALLERLNQGPRDSPVALIGLTATLPDPDSSWEAANYRGLLGEVDAELPLAAMVAEGTVAPWRDGIRLAQLTGPEQRFVDELTDRFATELDAVLADEPLISWAVAQVADAALDARDAAATATAATGDAAAWDAFWDRDPLTAVALARWWDRRGVSLPTGFDPPPQAGLDGQLTLTDRLRLVHAWLHDPMAQPSPDQDVRDGIARIANRYGVALTTAGIRWNRSAADLVCASSSAKGTAAAAILADEAARRGDSLRALVVVERDRATSPSAAVREFLGEDAATAARMLAALCAEPEVAERGVVLVTGRGAWCDALGAERVAATINVTVGEGRWVEAEGCDIRGAVRLAGRGGTWSPGRWLTAVEAALDDGAAQVLVSTRALVGEGWDYPPLNVLVDASDTASSTAATQLRGRAIRIDPADPAKLASLWDVAVPHPSAPGDWQRVRRRHLHWWGPDAEGAVTPGPAKLHPLVAQVEAPTAEQAATINDGSAAAVADREASREAWARVEPDGMAVPAVHVRRQRRHRVRIRGRGWRWQVTASAGSGITSVGVAVAAASTPLLWPVAAATGVAAMGLAALAHGRRRDERRTLLAIAEGITAGLVATGDETLRAATVSVEPDPSGGWCALVSGVPEDAARHWADALAEALGPLGTPRWIVDLGVDDQAWRVPAQVGATRDAATAFVAAIHRRVPTARLVRAGTPRATELVLTAARTIATPITRTLRWR